MRFKNFRILPGLLAAGLFALPALAGSVTGTVKYEGPVPKLRSVRMDADPGCAKKHTGPVKSEMLVLGDGNTMGNVFVRVISGAPAKDYPAPKEPVESDVGSVPAVAGYWSRIESACVSMLAPLNYPLRLIPDSLPMLVDWTALTLVFWVPIVWVVALLMKR